LKINSLIFQFKRNFRLSRTTVCEIISNFENSSFYPKNTAGRRCISAEAHILMFLWFSGNKTVMRITAQVFNCSQSICFTVFNRVIEFLLDILPNVIKMPSTIDEKKQSADEFKQVYQMYLAPLMVHI